MKLYISGGRHLATDSARLDDVEEALDSPDAVFEEARNGSTPLSQKVRNWISSPLLFVGIVLWLCFLRLTSTLISSDGDLIDKLEKKYDAKVYQVDKPLHQIIQYQRNGWGIANWVLIIPPSLLYYVAPSSTAVVTFVGLLIAAAIGSIMIVFLVATNSERNTHMIERIADVAQEDGIEEGCLVVGGKHEEELRSLAQRFDKIELVEI